MGAAALRPLSSCSQGVSAGAYGKWGAGTAEQYKKKRCDTVLYRRDLTARMIVEYKAPEIEITQKVFDQITRYNMVLKVDYLIVSNGLQHYCCRIDYEHNSYIFLQDIPEYQNL